MYGKQFIFIDHHSSDHALVELVDNIFHLLNKRKHTTGVFVDLSKVFDTTDHDILVKKLPLYGAQGNYLNWFKSYLTDRKQYTESKDFKTEMLNIIRGVPQGSILGPPFLSTSLLHPILSCLQMTQTYSIHIKT